MDENKFNSLDYIYVAEKVEFVLLHTFKRLICYI